MNESIRIDEATHVRLEALGQQVELSVSEIVPTLSHADFEVLLRLHGAAGRSDS